MNLATHLRRAALSGRDRPALAVGTAVQRSYGELHRRVAALAGALRGRFGLQPGDRVALAVVNGPAVVELLYACWHAGLAAVPINAKLHPLEFKFILENCGARVCFASPKLAEAIAPQTAGLPALERLIPIAGPAAGPDAADRDERALFEGEPLDMAEVRPDDLAWVFYTSGTTGKPKGAMLSHRNLLAMTLSYFLDVDHVAATDCILHAAPMSHGSGLYILPHIAAGACQVVPESGQFDPAEIFDLLPHYPGMTIFGAPTMVKRMVEHPAAGSADPANLKTLVYGGGPMYVEDLKQAMTVFGNRFAQIYGQGESPMTITALDKAEHANRDHPRYEERLASAGKAHSVVEVRVADDQGRGLPPGNLGEVLVRGDSVMLGYWNNPEASESALAGGWLHSGDMGVLDDDGYLTLKDRSKDVIISGGSNIYPREVEEVLQHHAHVLECAVIGAPHPDWGEEVVAFIVPRSGQNPDVAELDALCLERIARFKRPKTYRFVEALPKNNYGKVLKTELRERLTREKPSRWAGVA